jgi:hypothetical protein
VPPKWVPEKERDKPEREDIRLALPDAMTRLRGTYRCEERIEKGEFVMRWQAAATPLEPGAKEASGVVVVDLGTGKFRTQPLEKGRKIEEQNPPGTVEWEGIVFSVAESKHVGDWVKTLPPSRSIIEARMLLAVDKKTNKVLWEHTLWEWGYSEKKGEPGR